MTAILLGSKHTIEQMERIIQRKLLKRETGRVRARRKAWVNHRAKLVTLHSVLQVHKEDLVTEVSVRCL